jgi:predicted DNA-binding antitoxin AbrB/MazE fold protein
LIEIFQLKLEKVNLLEGEKNEIRSEDISVGNAIGGSNFNQHSYDRINDG